MLTIGKTQADPFNEEAWMRDLCLHLRSYHSEAVSGLDDQKLRQLVKEGLDKARAYGLTEPSNTAFFIALLFEIGPKFDENPHIQGIMNGEGTADERIQELRPHFPLSERAKEWHRKQAEEKAKQEAEQIVPMDVAEETTPEPAPEPEPTPEPEAMELEEEKKPEPELTATETPMEVEETATAAQEKPEEKPENVALPVEPIVIWPERIREFALLEGGAKTWVDQVKQGREWEGAAEWEPVWKAAAESAGTSPPKDGLTYTDIVAYAADRADNFLEPQIVTSCPPKPKKLENISAMFIPFEAFGTHYKRNADHGVFGFTTIQNDDGTTPKPPAVTGSGKTKVQPGSLFTPQGEMVARLEIKGVLEEIVTAECENIRLQYSNEKSRDDMVARFKDHSTFQPKPGLTAQEQEQRLTDFVNRRMGYNHYPTILILSENPTKVMGQDPKSKTPKMKQLRDDFPDRIETGESGVVYVRELALDKSEEPSIKAENEMAVYVREDFKERTKQTGGLSINASTVTREMSDQPDLGIKKKDEYMVKVTVSRDGYTPSSILGVHLRATLTGVSNSQKLEEEVASLDKFCADRKIDVVVGDFNFNVGVSPKGFRGVYTESISDERQKQTEYLMPEAPLTPKDPKTSPVASFPQSFSSSNNENFYMGIFLANPDDVRLTGPGVIGLQGASGARALPPKKGSTKPRYYSDHPAMYFELAQSPMPLLGKKRKSRSYDDSEDVPAAKKQK